MDCDGLATLGFRMISRLYEQLILSDVAAVSSFVASGMQCKRFEAHCAHAHP